MKMNLARCVPMLLVVLATAGCASEAYIKCQYQPTRKSPLSQLKPVKVLIEIDDQRPAEEREDLAKVHLDFMNKGVIKSKQTVPQIVAAALARELQFNGYQVTQNASDRADARVNVQLTRFFGTFALVEHTVLVASEVTVSREGRPSNPVLVTGTFRRQSSRTLGAGANPKHDINAALADYVHNFSFEPVVLEALR
jgi:hypothetical protein